MAPRNNLKLFFTRMILGTPIFATPHAAGSMDKRLFFPAAASSRDVGAQMGGFIRTILMAMIIMLLWISATHALQLLAAQGGQKGHV